MVRKILKRERKTAPRRKPSKPRKPGERKLPEGETDYGWCEEEELPTIEATFSYGKLIRERTNRKIIT